MTPLCTEYIGNAVKWLRYFDHLVVTRNSEEILVQIVIRIIVKSYL